VSNNIISYNYYINSYYNYIYYIIIIYIIIYIYVYIYICILNIRDIFKIELIVKYQNKVEK